MILSSLDYGGGRISWAKQDAQPCLLQSVLSLENQGDRNFCEEKHTNKQVRYRDLVIYVSY